MNVIRITPDNNIDLIDISNIKHQYPYARKIPNQQSYYYVFEDGDIDEHESINTLCSNLAKEQIIGEAYVVKSDIDITGLAFEEDCINCDEADLLNVINLCRK